MNIKQDETNCHGLGGNSIQTSMRGLVLQCCEGERMKAKYRVHRFDIKMTADQRKLEQFLNSLEGEVVAIIPNATSKTFVTSVVDFLLIVEEVS